MTPTGLVVAVTSTESASGTGFCVGSVVTMFRVAPPGEVVAVIPVIESWLRLTPLQSVLASVAESLAS